VPRYDVGSIIKDASCAWSSTGEGTLSQKQLEACSKDIQLELCSTTFENNFLSEYLRAGSNTGEAAPAQFVDYMIGEVGKKVQNDLEIAVWQGDVTGSTYPQNICDGVLKIADVDDDVIVATATEPILSPLPNNPPVCCLKSFKFMFNRQHIDLESFGSLPVPLLKFSKKGVPYFAVT